MGKSILPKIIITLVVIVACGGGGYLIWQTLKSHPKTNIAPSSFVSSNDSSNTSSSSLGVSGQSNLGQLDLGSNSSGQGGTTQGESGSSSSSSTINPSDFSQYQKYVNNPDALFGDVQAGTGAAVAKGQTVSITYKGWLTNGTLFGESSTDSNGNLEPMNFTLGSTTIIPGLQDGMNGMKVGGERLIIIPPALGYGNNPPNSSIPPNSVLIFDVKLLSAN
jgi:FKBP-type peptidyl-prolyl cis-trans isomerase FkpA